ncbi:MAG: metal ABC transporter permease [Oscillospiraceae bacterium]
MGIFQYEFMRRAFLVGILLAVIIPCIGTTVVLKRLSMIGDSLSHASLAGVAAGLIMGINPVLGATLACIIAAFGIEFIRKKLPKYAELSIAIIMSAGVGLAGVLSGYVKSAKDFNNFLFGSIVAISPGEVAMVIVLSLFVLGSFVLLYKELFFVSLDEHAARMAGVRVDIINTVFTLLTALTVSIASRTVGTMVVSSLMVVPVVCGMQLGKSHLQTVLYSVLSAVVFTVSGLFVSYYQGTKPGGTIVLIGVAVLLVLVLTKRLFKKRA